MTTQNQNVSRFAEATLTSAPDSKLWDLLKENRTELDIAHPEADGGVYNLTTPEEVIDYLQRRMKEGQADAKEKLEEAFKEDAENENKVTTTIDAAWVAASSADGVDADAFWAEVKGLEINGAPLHRLGIFDRSADAKSFADQWTGYWIGVQRGIINRGTLAGFKGSKTMKATKQKKVYNMMLKEGGKAMQKSTAKVSGSSAFAQRTLSILRNI